MLVERPEAGIAVVRLNRPDKLNALSRDLLVQLAAAFNDLHKAGDVRVAILTGSGPRAFSAGVDLSDPQSVFQGEFSDDVDVVTAMERASFPIIGAVNGWAITGGFEVALACDVLLASSKAKFCDTHAKFGLAPAWGLSQKLARLIGANRAREVSFTACAIDAATAEAWGLVNRVVAPDALMPAALDMARDMAANHPQLLPYYRRVLNNGAGLPLRDALHMERREAARYYGSMGDDEFAEMQAWIMSRPSKPKLRSKL